jgi:hypothetical protein
MRAFSFDKDMLQKWDWKNRYWQILFSYHRIVSGCFRPSGKMVSSLPGGKKRP